MTGGSLSQRATVFALMLIALACIPLAAREIVPDAGTSLLLPVTLLGALAAWGLVPLRARGVWKGLVLVSSGPLFLFLHVGQIGGTLMAACQASLRMVPSLIQGYLDHVAVYATGWIAAQSQLGLQVSVLWGRTFVWVMQLWRGAPTEDPTARALAWSIGLWLIAIWAGWQVCGQGRDKVLMGLFPATLLLGLVVNSNRGETVLLWFHLGALLLLCGVVYYETSLQRWEQARNDYVAAAKFNSFLATVLLTSLLILTAYFASNISIKHLIDELREKRQADNTAQSSEPVPDNSLVAPFNAQDLLIRHHITGNPILTHDVMMTISTGDLPPMPGEAHSNPIYYYWRSMTYDTYSRAGWSNLNSSLALVHAQAELLTGLPPGYRVVHQKVQFPSAANRQLYWTGTLLKADVPLQTAWRRQPSLTDPFFSADLLGALTSETSYSADSLQLVVNESDLRKASAAYPAWISKRYLTLPNSVPERVLALARNLTSTAPTPYDRARAIEAYLRQIPYTLDVPAPPPGRDPVDFFLFDLKKGYCDYYATAMVVLSRAAGLPARFVIGYSSGAYDSEQGYYVVTGNNAHAWAEVYFPKLGWVEFEPTASQPLPNRQGSDLPVTPIVIEPGQALGQKIGRFFGDLFSWIWPPFMVMILLALVWIPASSWYAARFQTEKAMPYFYSRLRQTARPLTGPLFPDQTLHEYAAALNSKITSLEAQNRFGRWLVPAHAEVRTLTDLYALGLFTPSTPTRAEVMNAAKIWSRLYWRLLLSRLLSMFGGKFR